MIRGHFQRSISSGRRGFTLVELVIVGALIALFSSLAVFGVQQQFRSNIRKAAIGETRQIATALDFANLDTSVFPKLCWLTESRDGMRLAGNQVATGQDLLPFGTLDTLGRTVDPTIAGRYFSKWNGPYFALSQTRSGVAQGRGGFVYMLLPDMPSSGVNDVSQNGIGLRWPSDPYNNPYVVYMLDLDFSTSPATLHFANHNSTDPTKKGGYVNAVVSYGPNHYPGGKDDDRGAFGTIPGSDAAAVQAPGGGAFGWRLYTGSPGYKPLSKGLITHTLVTGANLTDDRAAIWTSDPALNRGSTGGNLAITDLGTDDIIFEF
ncbi:hypothetical protein BH09SUM1_BH09SUM1_02020 [soil metagenome]